MKLGPYELNSITLGDCLEIMPHLPDKSIDMILADLPYGETRNAWDSIIPLDDLWKEYKRIIRTDGAIVLTAIQPFTSLLITSNLNWFRDEWVWDKRSPTNFLNVNKSPMTRHENILVFSEKLPVYNPQYRKEVGNGSFGKSGLGISSNYGNFDGNKKQGVGYPHSIIEFPRPTNLTAPDDYGLHPTQKPIPLFAYLIRTYSNPGDIILDNVAGSGTTAIAAIETGRNWLCIEKDEGYYRAAKKRIEDRLKQPFLPMINESGQVKLEQMELI